MKRIEFIIFVLAISALWGCSNTEAGAKEDIKIDSQKAAVKLKEGMDSASNLAANAGNNAKEVTESAGLTLKIKTAIDADKELNDSKNVIDVDTTKDAVTLSGHVSKPELKAKAAKIANEEMKKAKTSRRFENNLSVQ